MSGPIDDLRHSARALVRELNVLDGRACCDELTLSESHFLLELRALGEATASEMSERLLLDKSTVSRLCTSLQHKGLLSCVRSAGDRRCKALRLAPASEPQLATIDRNANRQVSEALDFVGENERELMVRGLSTYARALRYARLSHDYHLRPIAADDNPAVARIIREVMTEYGAVGPGYSINDTEIDDMHGAYAGDDAAFFVIERQGQVLGCGGIGPLTGGSDDTCELRKMYFRTELRGLGQGARLLNRCLDAARDRGYTRCYLETLASMHHARKLYARHGFEPIEGPLGDTGHPGCDRWMVRDL